MYTDDGINAHPHHPAPFFVASINGKTAVRSDLISGIEIRHNPADSRRMIVALPANGGQGVVVWQSRRPVPNNELDHEVIEQATRIAFERISSLIVGCPPVSVIDIHAGAMA